LGVIPLIPMYISDRFDVSDTNTKRLRRIHIRKKIMKLILFALFLMYPAVSARTASFFLCRRVNGVLYLEADFNLRCLDDTWYQYLGLDITMLFIYPVGIPLFFYGLLYKNRKKLRDPLTVTSLGFLYEAYNYDRWWFEMCDMAHKLFLTSILVFFPDSAYHAVGMVTILIYTVVILLSGPYVRRIDDRLHLTAQMYLLLIMLVGYILVQDVFVAGSSVDIFASFLCLAVLCLLFALLIYQFFVFIRKFIRNRQRLKQKRNEEYLTENPIFKLDGQRETIGSRGSVSGNHSDNVDGYGEDEGIPSPSQGGKVELADMRPKNISYLNRKNIQTKVESDETGRDEIAEIDPNAIPAMNMS